MGAFSLSEHENAAMLHAAAAARESGATTRADLIEKRVAETRALQQMPPSGAAFPDPKH